MADEIGSSDVPYSPTIVEKKLGKEFQATFLEELYKRGEQITEAGQITAPTSTSTFYTVPVGHTLFITNLWGSASQNGGNINDSFNVTTLTLARTLLNISMRRDIAESTYASHSYPFPLVVEGSQGIRMNASGTGNYMFAVGFTGILLKNDNIPQF